MKITKLNLQEKADSITQTVYKKNLAYGDSFSKCNKFLELLFPNGIQPDKYNDMLTIVRIFDKMMRIANKKHAFDENPWEDILGYALLKATKEDKNGDFSCTEISENPASRTQTFTEFDEEPCRDNGEIGWEPVSFRYNSGGSDLCEQGSALELEQSAKDVCSCSGNCTKPASS